MKLECEHEYEYKETVTKQNFQYQDESRGYTGIPTSQKLYSILFCKKCFDVKSVNVDK